MAQSRSWAGFSKHQFNSPFWIARAGADGSSRPMLINRRHLLASATAMTASGCTLTPAQRPSASKPLLPGAPLKVSEDRLIRITVCTRPFRPAGPRIEAQQFGEKTVIHNYGHGGSGWSLSWGCAGEAIGLVAGQGTRDFAVIGAGIIGLTTALRLVETGAKVTIYAKEFPSETRSARATGVWSPSSRIGLKSDVPDGFADKWEGWARKSFRTHQSYMGTTGQPVEFQPFYPLRPHDQSPSPRATRDFLHLDRGLDGLMPPQSRLADEAHAFPVASARKGMSMAFNIAAYTERLVRDFLSLGGRMERRTFPDRAAALGLTQPVIFNCTGYGAKRLWGADELAPVRGQINWMPAQPEARYGLFYKSVYVLSRGDGLVVQYVGPNDEFGYGHEDETPDLDEMRRTIETVAPLFSGLGV